MSQAFNPSRRQFLKYSAIAGGTLLLAPVLTKLNFVSETISTNFGPLNAATIDSNAYGQFPYGGVKA